MVSKGEVTAFFGLLNAMVGGTVLVLPLLGLAAGSLWIVVLCVFYGLISYYTCQLIVQHLGGAPSINTAILEHFDYHHSVSVFYNLVMSLALLAVIFNYYLLVLKQIQGFMSVTPLVAACLALILFLLTTALRSTHLSEKILAIGILSVIMYMGFLCWAHATAPTGPRSVPLATPNFINLGAALSMAYSVHDVVMQVLLKTTTKDKFTGVVRFVYVAGTIIYTFICFGCFSIVNRTALVSEPDVIEEYFSQSSWPVRWIQILYIFHMMTALPEFTIIMQVRLLQMFKIEEGDQLTPPETAIYFFTFILCLGIWVSKIKITTLVELNGSVIGFLYIFLIPIAVHIKCVYFTKHDENGTIIVERRGENGGPTVVEGLCQCSLDKDKKPYQKVGELVFQIFLIFFGLASIWYTIYTLFYKEEEEVDMVTHLEEF